MKNLTAKKLTAKNLTTTLTLLFTCLLFVSGCDLAEPINRADAPPPLPVPAPQPPQAEQVAAAQDEQEQEAVYVRAEPGVGARGQGITPVAQNNPVRFVQAPVSAMFRTEQRLAFMQVDHALSLFRAENGRGPNSHEEFMERIVRTNQLQLPRLPDGETYYFDARSGELMVRRPQ